MSDASNYIRGIRFAVVAFLLVVHGTASADAPAGRYTLTADTVADGVTGLVWQRNADAGSYTWAAAASYCQSLDLGGWASGWRLPTVKELQSVLDVRAYQPAMDPAAFPGAPSSYFWSSTPSAASSSNAWTILFQDGTSGTPAKTSTVRVRCVRTAGAGSNVAPVANAGPDQAVATGSLVTLDGSASSDADGDPLTYRWTFTSRPAGSAAALSSDTAVAPTFTADVAGTYVLSLTVNDGAVDGAPDAVAITAAVAVHVPDTGQVDSYTASAGEDADYAFNTPSYTDNGDGTVTDHVTQLVWQGQDDGTARQWDAADAYCASVALPGTGWRLPRPYELMTIQHFGRSSPAIDTAIFAGGRSAYYWTAYSGRTVATAWTADFWDGGVLTWDKAAAFYVRCVRGTPLASAFVDNGDGTVTDAATNLTWQQADDGAKKTWEEALAYCEGLTVGGAVDWRLPNVKELASLEDFSRYPVADLTFFPTTKENYYWSSTTVRSASTTAWQASFLGGSVGLPGLAKAGANAYVRCVRGQ